MLDEFKNRQVRAASISVEYLFHFEMKKYFYFLKEN